MDASFTLFQLALIAVLTSISISQTSLRTYKQNGQRSSTKTPHQAELRASFSTADNILIDDRQSKVLLTDNKMFFSNQNKIPGQTSKPWRAKKQVKPDKLPWHHSLKSIELSTEMEPNLGLFTELTQSFVNKRQISESPFKTNDQQTLRDMSKVNDQTLTVSPPIVSDSSQISSQYANYPQFPPENFLWRHAPLSNNILKEHRDRHAHREVRSAVDYKYHYYIGVPVTRQDMVGEDIDIVTKYLISNEEDYDASISIACRNENITPPCFIVSPRDSVSEYGMPPNYLLKQTGKNQHAVVSLKTDAWIHVWVTTIIKRNDNVIGTSITQVLPHMYLLSDYVVIDFPCQDCKKRMTVISSKDDNKVEIFFSKIRGKYPHMIRINTAQLDNPDKIETNLNQNELFFLETAGSLSGSRVKARHPISVFIGEKSLNGELSYENIFPSHESNFELIICASLVNRNIRTFSRFVTTKSDTFISGHMKNDTLRRGRHIPLAGDVIIGLDLNSSVNAVETQRNRQRPIVGLISKGKTSETRGCLSSIIHEHFWTSHCSWTLPKLWQQHFKNDGSWQLSLVILAQSDVARIELDGVHLNSADGWEDIVLERPRWPKRNYVYTEKIITFGQHRITASGSVAAYLHGSNHDGTIMFCTPLCTETYNHRNVFPVRVYEFPVPENTVIDLNMAEIQLGITTATPLKCRNTTTINNKSDSVIKVNGTTLSNVNMIKLTEIKSQSSDAPLSDTGPEQPTPGRIGHVSSNQKTPSPIFHKRRTNKPTQHRANVTESSKTSIQNTNCLKSHEPQSDIDTTTLSRIEKCTAKCNDLKEAQRNITEDEVLRIAHDIQQNLTVPKNKTKKRLRSLTSAQDNRPSSIGLGVVGIIICCLAISFVVIPDLMTIAKHMRLIK